MDDNGMTESGVFDLEVDFEIKKSTEEEQESGRFSGYGSIFGNKDLGNDIVMDGAFAKSLAKKGARGIKMLYNHKTDEPIGVFEEILEDRRGLKVKGQLALGTQRGKEVYELMKMGAIDGLSIGYRVDQKGYEYDERGKRRKLKEVDLMEISAVTFPMNPKARVQMVKNLSLRDCEKTLRDVLELSNREAKICASAIHKALNYRDDNEDVEQEKTSREVVESLESLKQKILGVQ